MRIERLLWDDWNEEHIARHGVDREEVTQMVRNQPTVTRARDGLYRAVGQTNGGRYLTAFLSPRREGTFYVVTARDATVTERRSVR